MVKEKFSNTQRIWSEEDIEYLKANVGYKSISTIAKHLKRTEGAINRAMEKYKLSFAKNRGYITINHLAKTLKIDFKTVRNWILNYDFPIVKHTLPTKKGGFKEYIDVDLFWKWAGVHKDKINWSKLDFLELPNEPDWVKDARREDYYKTPSSKMWGIEEDKILWVLFYTHGVHQTVIAKELGRTKHSVSKRLKYLREHDFATQMRGYDSSIKSHDKASSPFITIKSKQKVIQWTTAEDELIWRLYFGEEMLSYKEISYELNGTRSANSVEKRIRLLKERDFTLPNFQKVRLEKTLKKWSEQEDNFLLELKFQQKLSLKEIVELIPNRTLSAVETRLNKLISEKQLEKAAPVIKNGWTEEEDVIIWTSYFGENLSHDEIMKKLSNRTKVAIKRRLAKLKEQGYFIEGLVITRKPKSSQWSDEEDNLIKDIYILNSHEKYKDKVMKIQAALSERTLAAIEGCISVLKQQGLLNNEKDDESYYEAF